MRQAAQLGAISIVNAGIAFFFQAIVFAKLGAGIETDALFAGMTIPQLVLSVVSASLSYVLVPMLSSETEKNLKQYSWTFLVLVTCMFLFLASILFVAAPLWVPLTVPGFTEAGKALTIKLTRIQLVGMVFSAMNGVQWAVYFARKEFYWPEIGSLLASVASLLLVIFIFPQCNVVVLAWILTLKLAVVTVMLFPVMGYPVWPDFRNSIVLSSWRRIKPLLVGSVYYKTDPMIDRFLLSNSDSGSLSLYYLAQQIYGAVLQVVNKAVTGPYVTSQSILHKANDKAKALLIYNRRLLQVAVFCFAGILIFVVVGQNMLSVIIGHGNIHGGNINELWWIMLYLGGGFIGNAIGQISSTSFYSRGDTLTPTRIGIWSYTIYVPSKIVVYSVFGVKGLALITSLFSLMNFILQHRVISKKEACCEN